MASGGKESEGSDGEIRRPFNSGKKNNKKIVSSESEEDSDLEIRSKKVKPLKCESEANSSADELKENNSEDKLGAEPSTDLSDNEQSEKCAICLSKFLGQDKATPETCDHVFCLECLQEWAKNVNTCPIDRLKFNIILIRHHKEEKIIKKIFVNSAELPYNSELESESNTESQANFCEVCNEDESEGSLLLCHECQKFYHYGCIPSHPNPHMNAWQCPTCDSYIRIRDKVLLDLHRMLQGIKRRVNNARAFHRGRISQTGISQALRSPHVTTREFSRVRQRFLYQRSLVRSILSTSESSDEELENRSANSPFYQNQVVANGSKSRCPLMSTKRRNELYRARSQRLLASAATANSQNEFVMDSDEVYSDFRLPSPSPTENFDVVGSILQSQSVLHSPDVLTVSRDGTLLHNSSAKTSRTLLNLDTLSPLSNSGENSGSESPFANSSFFSDNAVSPYINKAVGKQIPLHSTQSNSKYGETPRQNYTCSSSAPRERSLSYDECLLSGSAFGGSGNERYNNEPNSHVDPKNFCCTSTSDDMKKTQPSNKDTKSHHSEDEVDIYSDIESVGEEDNSLSDQVEPAKISYKCVEESQQSDTNDVSDSTDNELVIDEDMPAEEENERITESQEIGGYKNNSNSMSMMGDANARASYPDYVDQDQSISAVSNKNHDKYTSRISTKRSSFEESSKKRDTQSKNTQMGESCSDEENQESDMEVQDEENSMDSAKKSYLGCGSNSGSVKSSPKSSTQCENSNYNENDFGENDNSALETIGKSTPEALNSCTNDNSNDSMSQIEVDEFHENNSNVSDSTSHVEQPYKHKKYNFSVASNRNQVSYADSNENSQICANSNSSSGLSPKNNRRILPEESAISQSENNSHFSFSSNQQNADRSEPEDGGDSNDSNCGDSQTENSTAFTFKNNDEQNEKNEPEDCTGDENSQNEHSEFIEENSLNKSEPNLNASKHKQEDSDGDSQAGPKQNLSVENDSRLEFSNRCENDDESDVEDITDSNPPPTQVVTGTVTTETINISNDETVKSENEYEDCESFEDASTPCLDENLEGEIENSPVQTPHCENANQEFSRTPDYEYENDPPVKEQDNVDDNNPSDNIKDEDDDLGIEDISEAGSEDLDEFPDEPPSDKLKSDHHKKTSGVTESSSQFASEESKKLSDHMFEDQEEGEIIEDKPVKETQRRKRDRYYDDTSDYVEHAPRMSISDLPRIPKLKRNREKENPQEPPSFDNKRTSVLSRVDLGAGDVGWKRLSKHTRERSYRDGRPKDEKLLYRERESRNKERKDFESSRRTDSKSSDRRREDKKKSSEKSKSESRSRKNDKSKENWNYSDRDKKKYHKDHKDRHSKEKHSKDRKDKHDKSRCPKEESKYDREKVKDDGRYERDSRYDKEERFERAVYEKTKSKDKDHKSKRKDRKEESNKITKDHSREKHKHAHPHENFLDKQREVRKIDDKLKIVVEQKDNKEKIKTKERKDQKYDKELHQRKRESERKNYSEMTSIESKEIFAKGDSIIINVSFNRNSSPKDVSTSDAVDLNSSDQILTMEDLDKDVNMSEDVSVKSKSKSSDKIKTSLDCLPVKRPVTPPERPNQVLSVSESYWQGGDDPDGNNSITSDKSDEESHHDDDNDSAGSAIDGDNCSNSSNSSDDLPNQETKDGILENDAKTSLSEEISDKFSKEDTFISKRRSPRSPSPPSPADNDSYDPCEPTKSPSPPPIPAAPPLPLSNPKPPPSPELPPLPPEPEPTDVSHEDSHNALHNQTPSTISSTAQPVTVETQTPSSLAFTGMLLPPPSFLSHSSQANSLSNISSLLPPRTMGFQINNANVLASNHMPPVMGGNFMHTDTSLPPPPNPPSIPHMTSVPPPPPPPSAMGLMSQIRHMQPPLPPNSILQNLGIAHNLNIPQLQLPPLPHLPPNLCAALANHQSPLPFPSQNLSTSLPSNITNQQSTRFLTPNQVPLMPNQNISNNKPHVMSITQMLSHCQTIPVSSNQKSEQPSKPPTPGEKNEVIDMDVESPYSPGDCSVDSVNDYSPTGSPLPSTPKETGDIFDTLFSADIRTSEKRPHDSASKHEHSKTRSGSKGTNEPSTKKSKHDRRTESKSKHSVKMQIEKNKKARKEQKIAEKILKLEDSQLKILDELPSSAVEMQVKEKFLKKLNRQERVIEEVKLALKPYYKSRDVNKEQYKDILRRAVPKICHNKSGEINPVKVKYLVECYIKKVKHSKKRSDKKKSKFS